MRTNLFRIEPFGNVPDSFPEQAGFGSPAAASGGISQKPIDFENAAESAR